MGKRPPGGAGGTVNGQPGHLGAGRELTGRMASGSVPLEKALEGLGKRKAETGVFLNLN
jgi:hypothetical protein